jgi:hypothetical protein
MRSTWKNLVLKYITRTHTYIQAHAEHLEELIEEHGHDHLPLGVRAREESEEHRERGE